MTTRALLTVLLALALVACSESGPREQLPSPDADSDAAGDTLLETTESDTAELDTLEPDTEADLVEPEVCGDGTCEGAEHVLACPEDCATGPRVAYWPFGNEISAFPDDYLTVEDASTPTGLRLDLTVERVRGLRRHTEGLQPLFDGLNELDGAGTSAPLYLAFDGALDPLALPPDGARIADGSPITLGWLDDEGAYHEVPINVRLGSYRRSMILRPMLPLPPGRHALLAVRTAALGAEGTPIHANRTLRDLLEGRAEGPLARLQGRYDQAVAALVAAGFVEEPDELAGVVVFTTGSVLDEGLRLRELVAAESFAVTETHGCDRSNPRYVRCDFTFEAPDVRLPGGRVAVPQAGPLARHRLPAVAYLPPSHPQGGPWPVLVFGHGLAGSRTQAARAAALVDQGWALIGLDAPGHGDHPQSTGDGSEFEMVLDFFGVSLGETPSENVTLHLDPRIMRGSLAQGTADKLALERALGDGVDLDEDGVVDLDTSRYTYLGVSLGAIMAPQYLALSDRVEAAVLVAGAGRAIDVLSDGDYGRLVRLAFPAALTEADVDRFFVLAQTVIDPADGGNFAPYVARDRLDGRVGIETLSGMALDDEVVPNSATLYLARTLGGVHVEPELLDAGGLALVPAPVSGNMPDGTTTGLLQLDWVNDAGTPEGWRAVDHVSVADSTVGITAWSHFLAAWRDSGHGEIIDPWQALGLTPPR